MLSFHYLLPRGPAVRAGKAGVSSPWHFTNAEVTCGLLVSIPRVLKIGGTPEVFGGGRLMPCSRRHAANAKIA
jgi:hypothetical protein